MDFTTVVNIIGYAACAVLIGGICFWFGRESSDGKMPDAEALKARMVTAKCKELRKTGKKTRLVNREASKIHSMVICCNKSRRKWAVSP